VPCGGLHETLGARRLLFRGFELAHLLARLGARPRRARSCRTLPRLLDFTGAAGQDLVPEPQSTGRRAAGRGLRLLVGSSPRGTACQSSAVLPTSTE
jgi:hypothetical protein